MAEVTSDFFGDRAYAAVRGRLNMFQTMPYQDWLSLASTTKKTALRSLDFRRLEDGLIRENWVMADLLHMHDQIGVDVFARLRKANKAQPGFEPEAGCTL